MELSAGLAPGGGLFRCIGHAGVHDGLADGAQGQGSQLDVLPGEGDADDCHGAGQGREQMPAGDPDTAEQQPDDIAHGAQRAGADVAFAGKDVTGDRHAAEGHEGETGHDEAGPAPGDADDADEAEHARDAPEQAGTQTEGEEPEDIAETAQSLHGKLLKRRGWSIHATRGRDACPSAGEGWAKRAGKMPHGAVISHSPSRKKALTQDGRRAGGQAGSGNDPGRPRHGRRAGRKGERLQFRQEKIEGGQHGGQQTELDQDHQPAGLAEGGKTAAGTPAHGAGLVPHLTEGRAFLFRKGDGRGVEGRPQRIEPGPERGLFPLQFPQR